MPIVTAQGRAQINADTNPNPAMPRKTVTVSTGMEMDKQESPRQSDSFVETTTPKEVTLSPQLTALARKEQALRQKEQAFKAEKEAIEKERAEYAKLRELKTKLDAKDYSVLEEMGVDYNEYSNQLINKLNGETPESARIRDLEAKLSKLEETQKSTTTKQYDATISQYKKEISSVVASNPEFDTIKSLGAEEHVLQHILDTFNEDGDILTVDQAAKEIEEALLEEAEKMAKLKKIQAKLQSAPSQQKKTLPAPRSGLRTLSNSVSQATPSTPRNQFQHMSMRERIAAAVAKTQK